MTELSPVSHFCSHQNASRKRGSVGPLLPNLTARLVASDGVDAQRGELWVRGPTVMKGYVHNKRATDETITPDGWLRTGDVAIVDKDGYFWIVDRVKELIKYKGFQGASCSFEISGRRTGLAYPVQLRNSCQSPAPSPVENKCCRDRVVLGRILNIGTARQSTLVRRDSRTT